MPYKILNICYNNRIKRGVGLVRIVFLLFMILSSSLFAQKYDLRFEGNTSLHERELYEALNLHQLYFYEFYKDEPQIDEKTFNFSREILKNFYKTKGFYHTEIEYEIQGESILFVIDEKMPLRIKELTITSSLDIKTPLAFSKGDIFDSDMFTQSKKDIKLIYSENKYCNVALDAKAWLDIETNEAYLFYTIEANNLCYFGTITINPSKSIDTDIIKSFLFFEEEDPFSLNIITRSYENLYANEGISKAIIDTKVKEDNTVDIVLSITENEKPVRFYTGLGASSDEGVMAMMGIKHRNMFSNLKTASIEARVTKVQQGLRTNYDMPLSKGNSLGVEIGVDNEIFEGFTENRFYSQIYLKQRGTPTSFQESLFFDNIRTYDSQDEEFFPDGNLFVLSPIVEWKYDTRDKLLDPRHGYFIDTKLMGSLQSVISDSSYYKATATAGYIMPLFDKTLAMKAHFGSLEAFEGELPASYRFYAGGMHSNRAYRYRMLGPSNIFDDPTGSESIFETTLEYRFDIYGKIRGVLFNDNTFLGDNYTPNYEYGYYSAGAGLRYVTPIGPIAFDLGFDTKDPMKQYAIHFHIGELF